MRALPTKFQFPSVGWFLPPLSPQPPFHPGGVERGSEQPHLISSLRLGHHWDAFLPPFQWRQFIPVRWFLPPLSPQPPLLPGGVERGSEQPHLISSQRPRHHWDAFLPLSQWRRVILSAYFLPPLSPRPPLLPSGEERGSEQPHLISSLRLGHHWPLLSFTGRRGCCASRRLAGATKSNVDLAPLSRPVGRERGWGRGWGKKSGLEKRAGSERAISGLNAFPRLGSNFHLKSKYTRKYA
jgi:hypothetical protein